MSLLRKTAKVALDHAVNALEWDTVIPPGMMVKKADRSEAIDVTIVLADDERLHQLNQTFLGVDAPTDVLSFQAGDIDPDSGHYYLGDVIISYPRVIEQAQLAGHTPQAELQLLVVHGILHLCGYDHADEAQRGEMWSIQSEILAAVG